MLSVLQKIDRRYLYAMLLFAVTLPFFLPLRLPVKISAQTTAMYDAIEALPPDSFVLFGIDWSAGTRGENGAQTDVLMRHLMRRHVRFALLAFADPQSETLGQDIAVNLQKEYGYVEGRDWTNWGYHPGAAQENFLKALVQDIPSTVVTDNHGHRIAELPVMHGVHTAHDLGMILNVNPTGSYTTYIQFVQGPYNVPMGFAPTAVMAPEAFNYLDSKQLVGMVAGLQGAVEYEQKMGVSGKATRANISSSFAHLLIIAFILLGNVAMILERRQKANLATERGRR